MPSRACELIKTRSWRAVASWHWSVPNESLCGICQQHYDGCCPSCRFPGDDCPLLSGACKHAFHMHCIVKWLQQQADELANPHCPMCRQEWREEHDNGQGGENEEGEELDSSTNQNASL